MGEFFEVRTLWQLNTNQDPLFLSRDEIEKVIKLRIKKERKAVAEYFWVLFAFQLLIYSFASYLFIRYWGDTQIVALCAAGAIVYVFLTIISIRKFRSMYQPMATHKGDIRANVRNQYGLLTRFFDFKKKFDLVAIPVNSIVLVGILLRLYMPGGIESHIAEAMVAGAAMILVFGIAAWFENKKHFKRRLRRFELIMEDMEKSE